LSFFFLGGSTAARVELPITDLYPIINRFLRSSSSELHFEWFKMLWERCLKL
jgi:hypothetical protein